MAAGARHTCGLSRNGIFCWGSENSIKSPTKVNAPPITIYRTDALSASGDGTCASFADGLYCYDEKSGAGFTKFNVDSAFDHYAIGKGHSCALLNRKAYCWGSNLRGQLGTGDEEDREKPTLVKTDLEFRSLVVGNSYTCGLVYEPNLLDGYRAYCWGSSSRIGSGGSTDRDIPTPVKTDVQFKSLHTGGFKTCGITISDEVYCWESGMPEPLAFDQIMIASGFWNTVFLCLIASTPSYAYQWT